MTTIDYAVPSSPSATGLLGRIGNRIGSGIRAVQYSRMVQALSELTDEQLALLDLTRADIPRHARACVYETLA